MNILPNKTNFIHRLWCRAAHITMVCCMLWLFVPVEAQVYSTAQYNPAQSTRYGMPYGSYDMQYDAQMSSTNYQPYQSTIYEPFGSHTPSGPKRSNGAIGEEEDNDDNNNDDWTGDFGNPADPNQSQNSPVGEAWVMLLFAAIAAIVVYCKQRKKEILSQKL